MTTKMHADELDIGEPLVRRLLLEQHPQWADLPITRVPSSGTDNAMFRLGDDLAVRMPRIGWAVGAVEKERRWLPMLAPHLPIAVPVPIAAGEPSDDYPLPWSVYSWLSGHDAFDGRLTDLNRAARDLAGFISALRAIDIEGGPIARPGNRGTPLAGRDTDTRRAIGQLADLIDVAAVTAQWDRALQAADWHGAPTWFHGDLASGNLLVRDDRITAVIDFGVLGVGDPSIDLMIAWELFDAESRALFRAEVGADDDSWERGRGWALSTALNALPYYLRTNPVMVAQAWRKIGTILDE